MNDFTNPKSMKKLTLMGACGGVIVAICSGNNKSYLRRLGYIMVAVLIGAGYELGLQDAREKEMNDLNDIHTELSEKFKTEETE